MADEKSIPYGTCHCGCGERTRIPKWNSKTFGYVKGVPLKYVHGHNQRGCTQTPEHCANIAKAHRGRKVSEATKEKLSRIFRQHPSITGPAHYQWKDGRATYRRGAASLRWARLVKRRDGYVCQNCWYKSPNQKGMHAHHVLPFEHYPDRRFDPSNGVTLCKPCHDAAHGRQTHALTGTIPPR